MFLQALRVLSDELGHAHIVTLYQAGNAIFDLFDKVLVLDHGKQIYYGPAKQAKAFMEDLGFQYTPGANVADFLASVTVPTERKVRDGVLDFPRNGTGVKTRYDLTAIKSAMLKEYNYPNSDEAHQLTASFKDEVMRDKHRSLPKRSSLTVGFRRQVQAAVIRQFQLLRGDCTSFFVTQASTVRLPPDLCLEFADTELTGCPRAGHFVHILQCTVGLLGPFPERRRSVLLHALPIACGHERGNGIIW